MDRQTLRGDKWGLPLKKTSLDPTFILSHNRTVFIVQCAVYQVDSTKQSTTPVKVVDTVMTQG